jgi:hypothetical protein
MTAGDPALEARVSELEQQVRHMLPFNINAVNYAVSLVHEDTRYLREQSDIHGAALERQEARLDRHGELLGGLSDRLDRQDTRLERQEARLDRHGELLQEILRRLPSGPAAP